MVRLYFNKRSAKPWSLDEGPGTTEHNYALVLVDGVTGLTRYTGDEPNDNTPVAWLEFDNAHTSVRDEFVAVIRADS